MDGRYVQVSNSAMYKILQVTSAAHTTCCKWYTWQWPRFQRAVNANMINGSSAQLLIIFQNNFLNYEYQNLWRILSLPEISQSGTLEGDQRCKEPERWSQQVFGFTIVEASVEMRWRYIATGIWCVWIGSAWLSTDWEQLQSTTLTE